MKITFHNSAFDNECCAIKSIEVDEIEKTAAFVTSITGGTLNLKKIFKDILLEVVTVDTQKNKSGAEKVVIPLNMLGLAAGTLLGIDFNHGDKQKHFLVEVLNKQIMLGL